MTIEIIQKKADECIASSQLLGIVLNYSIESLEYLDKCMVEIKAMCRNKFEEQELSEMISQYGSYFFEVIRLNYGGQLIYNPKEDKYPFLEGGIEFVWQVFPFQIISQFFNNEIASSKSFYSVFHEKLFKYKIGSVGKFIENVIAEGDVSLDPFFKEFSETKIEWEGGSKYEGVIRDGKLNGRGKMLYKNGDKYIGFFKNGEKDGYGETTWVNGEMYKGRYLNGKSDGYGIIYSSSGEIKFGGVWQNNELVKKYYSSLNKKSI